MVMMKYMKCSWAMAWNTSWLSVARSSFHGRDARVNMVPAKEKNKAPRNRNRLNPQNSRREDLPEKSAYFFVRHRMKFCQREGRVGAFIIFPFIAHVMGRRQWQTEDRDLIFKSIPVWCASCNPELIRS